MSRNRKLYRLKRCSSDQDMMTEMRARHIELNRENRDSLLKLLSQQIRLTAAHKKLHTKNMLIADILTAEYGTGAVMSFYGG